MNSVIWKFTLNPVEDTIAMPEGARILHVREQFQRVCIWAEVDPEAAIVNRRFGIGLTGQGVPPGGYVGTAHVVEEGLATAIVVHLYDQGEEA